MAPETTTTPNDRADGEAMLTGFGLFPDVKAAESAASAATQEHLDAQTASAIAQLFGSVPLSQLGALPQATAQARVLDAGAKAGATKVALEKAHAAQAEADKLAAEAAKLQTPEERTDETTKKLLAKLEKTNKDFEKLAASPEAKKAPKAERRAARIATLMQSIQTFPEDKREGLLVARVAQLERRLAKAEKARKGKKKLAGEIVNLKARAGALQVALNRRASGVDP